MMNTKNKVAAKKDVRLMMKKVFGYVEESKYGIDPGSRR